MNKPSVRFLSFFKYVLWATFVLSPFTMFASAWLGSMDQTHEYNMSAARKYSGSVLSDDDRDALYMKKLRREVVPGYAPLFFVLSAGALAIVYSVEQNTAALRSQPSELAEALRTAGRAARAAAVDRPAGTGEVR